MNKYIRSPFNYTGSKYKILDQVLGLFPNKINTFYDVFGGGGSVSLNVNSEYVYYNDIVTPVVDTLKYLCENEPENTIEEIYKIVSKYELSLNNEVGFKQLRDDYNNGDKNPLVLFVLMCYSFNYQFRFNNKGEYNSSFGKNKSCFRKSTEDRIFGLHKRLCGVNIGFDSLDYLSVDYSDADGFDLIYFDPPYLISCASYNDGKRGFKGWSKKDDIELMKLCDKLDTQNTRFAMSNVFENNGLTNEKLIEWAKKYKVYHLSNDYSSCNHQRKGGSSDEVLIVNY